MKFVHMADAHLGMEPDKGRPWSKERGKERWDTFRKVIDLCVQEQVDLLLIAGDLFHKQPSVSDIKETRYLFSKLSKTRVVMIAGNHDYLSNRSRYPELIQEGRIMLLPGGEVSSILIPACNTTVYGVSYTSRAEEENLYQGIRPHRTRGHHILLAHGGDIGYMPFDRRELSEAGFDYVALGHIHKPERFGSRMAYSGSLDPMDRTETGEHGVILGELNGEECRLEFRPLAERQYRELILPVTEESTIHEVCDQIREQIDRQGVEHLYQVLLQGYRDPEMFFDIEHLMDLLNEYRVVEILDQSKPYFDFEQLKQENRDNLIGQFLVRVEVLYPAVEQQEQRERIMAAGVTALLSTMK